VNLVLRIVNFAAFYAGWFACVVGAARGMTVTGPLVVAVFLALHLALSSSRARELRLLVAVGGFGFAIDSAQAFLGVFHFEGAPGVWMCPPWLVALWLMWGSTLNGSMSWLGGRPLLAAGLGAISGPASYLAAARIGALAFPDPFLSAIVLALVWAAVMPSLFVLRDGLMLRPVQVRAAAK
jgi:hypothetical protein